MLGFQSDAISKVRKQARNDLLAQANNINKIASNTNLDIPYLVQALLAKPITINFHLDRITKNSKLVIESLIADGTYQSQFITGTTNGGNTAYIGGQRFTWEQEVFLGAYPQNTLERPKYGALNVFDYIDGGSMRFGSCYFILKQSILNRCTFSYGDSSLKPKGICTSDTFELVVLNLLLDIQNNNKMFNKVTTSMEEAISTLIYDWKSKKILGRNLDHYIEVHIHSDINLATDVESLFIDSSFVGTHIEQQANLLCEKYDIFLDYIPKREIKISSINSLFRGDKIKPLADKISLLYGHNGHINSYILGKGSCDSIKTPANWQEFGSHLEIFQYIKQLWHTIGYFG